MHYPLGRPLIMMDPRKLSYFARAAAVRAGASGADGSLAGFGTVDIANEYGYADLIQPPAPVTREPGAYVGPGSAGGWSSDTAVPYIPANDSAAVAKYNPIATADNTTNSNGTASIDAWMNRLNKLIVPSARAQAPGASVAAPSILPIVLGGVGLLVGGVILFKMLKKK